MKYLSIDLGTYNSLNLSKTGVYPYSAHPDFEILLFGYAVNGGPVQVVDLASGEKLPDEILAALVDPGVVKWAFNASFERICFSSWLHRYHPELLPQGSFLDSTQWRCSMVWAAYLGMPMSLDQVARVLDLPVKKDAVGKKLIHEFCTPATPNLINKGACRNLPSSDPEGWKAFIEYNRRDVKVEQAIHAKLARFPVPEAEWEAYTLDQRINDAGINLDATLVNAAVTLDEKHRETTLSRAQEITGLDNPNSPIQLKDWLTQNGCPLDSLTKAEVATALEDARGVVKEILQLRGNLAKSSVKKYQAMQNVSGADGRACGLLQFY